MSYAEYLGLAPIPATLETVATVAPMFGAIIHGDTDTEIDVEFPDVRSAISFIRSNPEGWELRLRDRIEINDINGLTNGSVVLIVKKS